MRAKSWGAASEIMEMVSLTDQKGYPESESERRTTKVTRTWPRDDVWRENDSRCTATYV